MEFTRPFPNRLFDSMSDDLRTRAQFPKLLIEPAQIRICGVLCGEPVIGGCSRTSDPQHVEAEHTGSEHPSRRAQVKALDCGIGADAVSGDRLPPVLMQAKEIVHESRNIAPI